MPHSLTLGCLLVFAACAPQTGPAATRSSPVLPDLIDVSGDDCIASALVFDRAPTAPAAS